jgi:hypothetical protein
MFPSLSTSIWIEIVGHRRLQLAAGENISVCVNHLDHPPSLLSALYYQVRQLVNVACRALSLTVQARR